MSEPPLQAALRAHRAGDLARAARLYSDILDSDERNFDALYGLAAVHFQRREYGEAERVFGAAVRLVPNAVNALHLRGRALARLGREAEAMECYDSALRLMPRHAEALCDRGNLLLGQLRHGDAARDYAACLALEPGFAEAWHNRGVALSGLKHYAEAITCFGKALELRPESLETRYNRAHALYELKRFEEAIADYERVLETAPERPYIRGYLLLCRLNCCDWSALREQKSAIAEALRAGKRVIQPFGNVMISTSPAELRRCAELWVSDGYEAPFVLPPRKGPHTSGKIRIAYLSADFRRHPVGLLMAGVFEHHDKSRFETIALSFGPDDGSKLRARLARAFDRFIDIRGQSDQHAAEALRDMDVDIAVDLTALTADSRSRILAFRPAPIQVNYLGYPGTMGASYMDYILADRIVIPAGEEEFYREKIAYLPVSYMAADDKRKRAGVPDRAAAGLPEAGFVFCSFNNSYKFTPEMFDIWMRLLRAVENSVLWLPQPPAAAVRNLRREARARGVADERLVFAPFLQAPEDHLARLGLADLFLDTQPCNAHSTASDALWAGLPVLTCPGSSFAGRVAASLLHAAGLPQMATPSLEAYEALALKLARDPAALAAVKAQLGRNRGSCTLFDTERFTRHLEAAYEAMWARYCAGGAAAGFAVAERVPSR